MNDLQYDYMTEEQFEELDDMVNNGNRMALERKLSMFKNKTRDIGNFFSYVNESKIEAVAKLAVQRNFESKAFIDAMSKIALELDSFPSFKDIKRFIEICSPDKGPSEEEKKRYAIKNKEDEDYNRIKNEFLKLMGQETLDKYVQWWVKNTFPELDIDFLKPLDLKPNAFDRCALFDWYDSGMSKDFERIKRISLAKLDHIAQHINNDTQRIERLVITKV